MTRCVIDVHQERLGLGVGKNKGNGRGLDTNTSLKKKTHFNEIVAIITVTSLAISIKKVIFTKIACMCL